VINSSRSSSVFGSQSGSVNGGNNSGRIPSSARSVTNANNDEATDWVSYIDEATGQEYWYVIARCHFKDFNHHSSESRYDSSR
jgi:hypothetical protein